MKFNEWLILNRDNLIFLVPTQPLQKIFFVKYKSSSSPTYLIPFKIQEKHYRLDQNYKVELKPINSTYEEMFGSETFYIEDFKSLIKQNIVKVLKDEKEKVISLL